MKWIAFFSQTGSEIVEISKQLNRFPDFVITNRGNLEGVNTLLHKNSDVIRVPNKPVYDNYLVALPNTNEEMIITLNGYLRIIPPDLCNQFNIYNGHPGYITEYPELKGKDPQKKAFELKHKKIGCVIHKVTSELDGGEIIDSDCIYNEKGYNSCDEVISILHNMSVNLWVKFLKSKLC